MKNRFPPSYDFTKPSALPVRSRPSKYITSASEPVRIEPGNGRILIYTVKANKLVGFIAKGKLVALVNGVIHI